MMSSRLWRLVLAVWLAGCAGPAPSLRNGHGKQPAAMTGEEACRDPTALVLLCGEHACAFYRCSAAALLGNAPREVAPVQAATPGKVVLAYVEVEGVEAGVEPKEEEEPPLGAEPNTKWWVPHAIGLPDPGPVFIIKWGQPARPRLSLPSLAPYSVHLLRLPHALHSIFPPEEEFRAWFASKGIAPGTWTMPLPTDEYSSIHDGPEGDLWNAAWREFIRAAPEASATEVWKHAGELCLRFGLFEAISAGPPPIPSRAGPEETVTHVELDAATRDRVDKALAECAEMASMAILGRRMNGRTPTPEDCREEVGRDSKGRPITRAQQFGLEMHQVALQCAREKLGKLRPFGFSIEPRYRYDPQSGRATPVSPEEEEILRRMGLERELLGTIVPDVVIHAGSPARVQLVYDYKFPCVDPDEEPRWRRYPPGHPYQGERQDEVYKKALGTPPAPVTPRRGVIR